MTSPPAGDSGRPSARGARAVDRSGYVWPVGPRAQHDAVVVGSGPNGLTAAAVLASAGLSVVVLEGQEQIGGGTRSLELTLPGFVHDHCSAVHPLGVASRAFRELGLEQHGLRWLHPEVATAHPLDGGGAAVMTRSIDETADAMGVDADAWHSVIGPVVKAWPTWIDTWLSPILRIPRRPFQLLRSAPYAALPAVTVAGHRFTGEEAKAAFAGFAAHSIAPLDQMITGAAGLLFNAALHAVGMPVAQGGSQSIADALASVIHHHGGEIRTGTSVKSPADLPPARVTLLDVNPAQAVNIGGDQLEAGLGKRFARYGHGWGSFKLDLALDGPVPWTNEACRRAGTVHVGGTMAEVADAESQVSRGQHPEQPFLITSQPTLVDPGRAPEGKHIFWAYCHVPPGSTIDRSEQILRQVERFAPGFRDRIIHTTATAPADFERTNHSMVGGDIAGGRSDGLKLVFRPRIALNPWRIGSELYLCSHSTAPGAGVHGMAGWWAAQAALKDLGHSGR